jgi:hypothetical protein
MSTGSADRDASDFCEGELPALHHVLAALSGAFKKLNLYSGSHSIYQSALVSLKGALDDFCDRFGELRLELERERIRCHGRVVSEGTPGRGDLWYVLHRDGILWICFPTGPELWELDTFLNIAHKYLNLDDDEEDDVVTALWEFDMPAIHYAAADLELNECDVIDFSELPCIDPEISSHPEESEPKSEESAHHQPLSGNDTLSLNEDCLWHLTQEERRQLRQMVAETELMDGTDYVVDVLLVILEQQVQPADEFDNLLDALRQELDRMLMQGRFTSLYGVLVRMGEHVTSCRVQSEWKAAGMEAFFESLADQTFLGGLTRLSDGFNACTPAEMKALKRVLMLLGGAAVPALGALLAETDSPGTRKLLMEGIGSIALRDYRPLERLISSSGAEMVLPLVPLLGFLTDPRSRQTLSGLLCNESEEVRRAALRAIIARDAGSLNDIFTLIDDPDERIRALILEHMGQQRSEAAEALLLDYLENNQLRFKDPNKLYAICKTLGKCGSDRSIAFLETHLNTLPLPSLLGSGRVVRRKAALIALKELRTERAAALIEKSTRGILGRIFNNAV